MANLVTDEGRIRFGFYDEPVDMINYSDYDLETPMGVKVPRLLRKFKANQFHFSGIIGPEIIVGMAVIDLKYIADGFLYVYDRKTRTVVESKQMSPFGIGGTIVPNARSYDSSFSYKGLEVATTSFRMMASSPDISLDVKLTKPVEPLRLCTRTGYRGWVYMEKTTPIPVAGKVTCRGKTYEISSPDYMALMDWTTGHMRRDTYWEWAATASTLPDGRPLGFNLCCGVNDTSFTENVFWIAGEKTKVDTVNFVFDNRDLYKPWKITSYDGRVDLTFNPEGQRGEKLDTIVVKSKFSQFLGTFEGTLKTESGEVVEIKDIPGWAEDHYAKW